MVIYCSNNNNDNNNNSAKQCPVVSCSTTRNKSMVPSSIALSYDPIYILIPLYSQRSLSEADATPNSWRPNEAELSLTGRMGGCGNAVMQLCADETL
jgi:hypothetical protein